jgi:hypothetical protein
VVGAAAVVAVLVYNRMQEIRGRREAQRAFASQHADALLDESPRPGPPPRKAEMQAGDMPDARLDYVVDLEVPRSTLSATVLEHWRPLEQRFAHRALLAGSDGTCWRRVVAGDVRSLTLLRASLQMVSRSGVVSDAELLEFRSAAETMGAALTARVSAPEMREALDSARALDKLCADADIQVALHVAGAGVPEPIYSEDQPFHVESHAGRVSLVLDVPHSAEPARAFEAMARAARQLAEANGGQVVDDNGTLLDERALLAIGAELDAVRARLAQAGIEPGSELALRLFS